MASYYEILGVKRNVGDKEIREAFRRLARQYHPDLNPNDKRAEEKFKRINEAYEVLSDRDNRVKYDKYGDKWKLADQIEAQHGEGASSTFNWSRSGRSARYTSGGVDDLLSGFGGLLGHRSERTTTSIEGSVDISLEEAFSGAKRTITLSGRGKDRRIEVTIPPGVDTGSVVRVILSGGQKLLLRITVAPHTRFRRQGSDLFTDVELALEEAILGGEADVHTMNGTMRVKVPPEAQNGQRIRLKGQGMPGRGSGVAGDMFAVIRPRLPKNLADDEKELIQEFRLLRSRKR